MTTCRRCGRMLTYPRSIRHGCGSFCYYKKGCLPEIAPISSDPGHSTSEKGSMQILTRSLIIGIATSISCVAAHVVCLAATFYAHHDVFIKGAGMLYSLVKNRQHSEEDAKTLTTKTGNIAFNKFTESERNSIANEFAKDISSITGSHNIPESWSIPIAIETAKIALSSGSSTAFNWGSKMLSR
ncbi:MAG: hypothetical protein QXU18_14665 [Thermoplasmatales archaeon]